MADLVESSEWVPAEGITFFSEGESLEIKQESTGGWYFQGRPRPIGTLGRTHFNALREREYPIIREEELVIAISEGGLYKGAATFFSHFRQFFVAEILIEPISWINPTLAVCRLEWDAEDLIIESNMEAIIPGSPEAGAITTDWEELEHERGYKLIVQDSSRVLSQLRFSFRPM